MHAIYLIEPGPNRLAIMKYFREKLGVSLAEAKRLLSADKPLLTADDCEGIIPIEDALASLGCKTYIRNHWHGIDIRSWIEDDRSIDKIHCLKCGAKVLYALPEVTSDGRIREPFVPLTEADRADIAMTRQYHPGIYCPNRCWFYMVDGIHYNRHGL